MNPPPTPHDVDGAHGADADRRVLHRIRALLAKAESTEFASEADTFSAKAQQLMARHQIHEAAVAGTADGPGGPGAIEFEIEAPYVRPKFQVLANVADANRCKAVYSPATKMATVVGFATDRAFVEALYTSLLVQGSAELQRAGPVVDQWGVNRIRSFRNSFWAGFAARIGDRLAEAARGGEADAPVDEREAALPVLVRRAEAVDEEVHRRFPALRHIRASVTNLQGWHAGDAAGARVDLAARAQVPG